MQPAGQLRAACQGESSEAFFLDPSLYLLI
jgi:hypothetical protein